MLNKLKNVFFSGIVERAIRKKMPEKFRDKIGVHVMQSGDVVTITFSCTEGVLRQFAKEIGEDL